MPTYSLNVGYWRLREIVNTAPPNVSRWNAFAEIEQARLKPLPDVPPEQAVWAKVKVHGDGHVQFEHCRYSVPYTLIRETLWLKASDTMVRIYQGHELKATHTRMRHQGGRATVPEHQPPAAQAYNMQDPQYCLTQAKRIGESCHVLIKRLFASRVLDNLRAAQGVVGAHQTLR